MLKVRSKIARSMSRIHSKLALKTSWRCYFDIPWKCQNTRGFLAFTWVVEMTLNEEIWKLYGRERTWWSWYTPFLWPAEIMTSRRHVSNLSKFVANLKIQTKENSELLMLLWVKKCKQKLICKVCKPWYRTTTCNYYRCSIWDWLLYKILLA